MYHCHTGSCACIDRGVREGDKEDGFGEDEGGGDLAEGKVKVHGILIEILIIIR